jgi:hypothetical protein
MAIAQKAGQYGGNVTMIRQQWPGLERFLQKNGKYLPPG